VDVGKKYFDMNEPNLNVIVQDGRWALAHSQELYQVISVDAYRPPYIPWHMTTKEFFQIVRDHLTPDGVMAINVGRGPTDRRLINALSSTILSVFPSIYIVDIPNTFNSMIFATKLSTDRQNLFENYIYLQDEEEVAPLLKESIAVAVSNLMPVEPSNQVFTDDTAPVEWITNSMVLDFLLFDNMEDLN
jgi:spermidine synthase